MLKTKRHSLSKGEETKQNLIQVALDLFYKKGVHWVSFQQIATEVNLTQAALYRYFEDKDELIQACALYSAKTGRAFIDQHVPSAAPARERIRTYIEGNLLWALKFPKEANALLAMYYFALKSKKIRDVYLLINQQSIIRLSTHLSHGNHEKVWKIEDCEQMARIIHNLLVGEMLKTIHTPKELSLDARMSILWSALMKLLPS